jgi:hypothetical protein
MLEWERVQERVQERAQESLRQKQTTWRRSQQERGGNQAATTALNRMTAAAVLWKASNEQFIVHCPLAVDRQALDGASSIDHSRQNATSHRPGSSGEARAPGAPPPPPPPIPAVAPVAARRTSLCRYVCCFQDASLCCVLVVALRFIALALVDGFQSHSMQPLVLWAVLLVSTHGVKNPVLTRRRLDWSDAPAGDIEPVAIKRESLSEISRCKKTQNAGTERHTAFCAETNGTTWVQKPPRLHLS